MNSPPELGRNYAAATYTLLKETDDVRFRGWGEGYRLEQLDNLDSEIRRALDAAHERVKAADICVRQHAQTIADLPVGSQAEALRAMYTQFDRNLRVDLAETIRRCRDRHPGCNHGCDEHRPCGLGVDADIEPLNAESIRKIQAWYEERKPKEVGHSLGFGLCGGIWLLNSMARELDHNPHPDEAAAIPTSVSRKNTAEAIAYLEETLVQVEGCDKAIATYDGRQVAKALEGFRACIEKTFERRIHAAKHALATDPLEPCDYPTCRTRPNDPWS